MALMRVQCGSPWARTYLANVRTDFCKIVKDVKLRYGDCADMSGKLKRIGVTWKDKKLSDENTTD